jgi:hypothetical protein
MLCTVVIVAFLSNEKEASLFAFFGGIVIEAMGSTGISLLPLIYFITAYFLGSAARYNHKKIFTALIIPQDADEVTPFLGEGAGISPPVGRNRLYPW